jgi:hypothetical protein
MPPPAAASKATKARIRTRSPVRRHRAPLRGPPPRATPATIAEGGLDDEPAPDDARATEVDTERGAPWRAIAQVSSRHRRPRLARRCLRVHGTYPPPQRERACQPRRDGHRLRGHHALEPLTGLRRATKASRQLRRRAPLVSRPMGCRRGTGPGRRSRRALRTRSRPRRHHPLRTRRWLPGAPVPGEDLEGHRWMFLQRG